MQHNLIDFMLKYGYQGKYFYFTYMEGDQFSYPALLLKLGEEFPEWQLVQVLQRVELVRTNRKIHTVGNDGNAADASAVHLFTPLFKIEVKHYDKLPGQIKKGICANMDNLRAASVGKK